MELTMVKVIAGIAVVLAIAIAVVLVLAASKPDTFRVERSATINAPPERIFAALSDFRRWGGWSPWETKDPAMKRTYEGAERGKGAVYGWEGDRNVGTGRMEIVEANAPSNLRIKLDFLKPFEAHNIAEFTLLPQGNATRVQWAMHGPATLITRIVHVFMDMDAMVGKDFEAGLANLKNLAEK
jgi:uncharacterized protein YndB with AHSA1/START domain